MDTIGQRLKQERQRLEMTQAEFAETGGVKKLTQIAYEQDRNSPDTAYLGLLMAIGVDVCYVLTGHANAAFLNQEESELISGYRLLDTRGKAGVLALIDGMKPPASLETTTPKVKKVKFAGTVHQVIEGNQKVAGSVNFGLDMTRRKPKR